MAGPARTGVLIYAKELGALSSFYERILGARVVHSDSEHTVLQTPDIQLLLHAIPPQYSSSIVIEKPPEPREEQAFKPFFTVANLAHAERITQESGGVVMGPVWPGPGIRMRNVCDPEGNIVQLREMVA